MGNRANVVFHNPKDRYISPVCYLHWNGGPESVYAFLDELDRRNVRTTVGDPSYEFARFVHVVGDFMDHEEAGSLSLGVFPGPKAITVAALDKFDNSDNGTFVVTRGVPGLGRVVRRFVHGSPLRELSRDEVEAERVAAYEHPYHGADGIPDTFARIRPKIAKYG